MKQTKRSATPFLHRIAHASATSTLLARRMQVIRIIMFHGVGCRDYPRSVFHEQMLYLRKNFSVVPLDTILSRLDNPGGAAWNEVALTFDDGLRNNGTQAYPILRSLKLPATFYVCPGLVENRSWIWTNECRARLRFISEARRRELARWWSLPSSDPLYLMTWLKSLPCKDWEIAIAQLRDTSSSFEPSSADRLQFDLMSWEEISALDPNLITIGSHTINHPVLTGSTYEQQHSEIKESQAWIERRLKQPVRHFCYPDAALDSSVTELVSRYYDSAVADVGLVRPGANRFHLPRIPATDSCPYLAWRLIRPAS